MGVRQKSVEAYEAISEALQALSSQSTQEMTATDCFMA